MNEKSDISYRDKVLKELLTMTEPLEIAKKVKPYNRELFIQTVKDFIKYGFDTHHGKIFEFNNDYTKVITKDL